MPSHYLTKWWNIVNLTLRNKLQLNSNPNSYIFIQENTFQYVVCEMLAILSWPQCVHHNSELCLATACHVKDWVKHICKTANLPFAQVQQSTSNQCHRIWKEFKKYMWNIHTISNLFVLKLKKKILKSMSQIYKYSNRYTYVYPSNSEVQGSVLPKLIYRVVSL